VRRKDLRQAINEIDHVGPKPSCLPTVGSSVFAAAQTTNNRGLDSEWFIPFPSFSRLVRSFSTSPGQKLLTPVRQRH